MRIAAVVDEGLWGFVVLIGSSYWVVTAGSWTGVWEGTGYMEVQIGVQSIVSFRLWVCRKRKKKEEQYTECPG
jgi:hypothetical protein